MFGSSKPFVGDFDLSSLLPVEQRGETANYEDYDYDNKRRLVCIEYKKKKAIVEENDAKENNFLPLLVYIGLGENKGNGEEYDDKRNDFLPSLALEFDKEKGKDEEGNDFLPCLEYVELDEKKGNDECCADKDIEFVPRLVYVELKAKKVEDENIELDGDGYCGYDDGNDDPESEDEKLMDGDDLKRRIEEFIAKNNKRWKEEI